MVSEGREGEGVERGLRTRVVVEDDRVMERHGHVVGEWLRQRQRCGQPQTSRGASPPWVQVSAHPQGRWLPHL